jgi:hypothetical protein
MLGEESRLICTISNQTESQMTVIPKFEVYKKNVLSHTKVDVLNQNEAKIQLDSYGSREEILEIPLMSDPSSYGLVLYFTDESGKRISQDIETQFTVFGMRTRRVISRIFLCFGLIKFFFLPIPVSRRPRKCCRRIS